MDNILIDELLSLSRKAGDIIMEIYNTDFSIKIKSDYRNGHIYHSPVTEADKQANNLIVKVLNEITPNIPVLSEEGLESKYENRKKWKSYWLVDPLDGTKEFINRNKEFTVNIGFIENNCPKFGIVYAPALNRLFWGGIDYGSYKMDSNNRKEQIFVTNKNKDLVNIAVSRSHPSSKLKNFLTLFNKYSLHPMGSSLKICLVAEGKVDYYPRFGPTMEWDTAAAHAITKGAGGDLIEVNTDIPLKYNKQSLLNPEFIASSIFRLSKLK